MNSPSQLVSLCTDGLLIATARKITRIKLLYDVFRITFPHLFPFLMH